MKNKYKQFREILSLERPLFEENLKEVEHGDDLKFVKWDADINSYVIDLEKTALENPTFLGQDNRLVFEEIVERDAIRLTDMLVTWVRCVQSKTTK